MELHIISIPKSNSEEIRIALTEYETKAATHQMVSARVFYEDGREWKPGRNGINVKVDLLPDLIAALQEAEREAQAAGLLPAEGTGS